MQMPTRWVGYRNLSLFVKIPSAGWGTNTNAINYFRVLKIETAHRNYLTADGSKEFSLKTTFIISTNIVVNAGFIVKQKMLAAEEIMEKNRKI